MSHPVKIGQESPQNQRSSLESRNEEAASAINPSLDAVPNPDESQIADSSFDLVKDEKDFEKSAPDELQNERSMLDPASPTFRRPFSNLRWSLVAIGLYLGAFLYGKPSK